MISAFIVRASRKSRTFIQVDTRKAYMVLAQLVYALLAGHKRPGINGINDLLASRVCMNVPLIFVKLIFQEKCIQEVQNQSSYKYINL